MNFKCNINYICQFNEYFYENTYIKITVSKLIIQIYCEKGLVVAEPQTSNPAPSKVLGNTHASNSCTLLGGS